MTSPAITMSFPSWAAVANHLWQSTLVASVAGVLTLVLKRNRAQARYWLWLAASVKFLLPFSLLVSLGSHWEWTKTQATTQPGFIIVIEDISQPFSAVPGASAVRAYSTAFAKVLHLLPALLFPAWFCGCMA